MTPIVKREAVLVGTLWLAVIVALAHLDHVHAQPQPPGPPLACGGGVTVLLNGAPFSTGCVLNIKAGNGILATPMANPAIGGTDLSFSFNSVLVPTHDQIHHSPNFCNSTNGTTLYTCKLPNKALLAYQLGDVFELLADSPCNQNCQVNIDGVGALNIWSRDGLTAATFPASQLTPIWYDGKTMRLL